MEFKSFFKPSNSDWTFCQETEECITTLCSNEVVVEQLLLQPLPFALLFFERRLSAALCPPAGEGVSLSGSRNRPAVDADLLSLSGTSCTRTHLVLLVRS